MRGVGRGCGRSGSRARGRRWRRDVATVGGGLESGGPLLLLFEDGIVAQAISLRLLAIVARGMCLVALDMEQTVARQHLVQVAASIGTKKRVRRTTKVKSEEGDATGWSMMKRDAVEWRCCE